MRIMNDMTSSLLHKLSISALALFSFTAFAAPTSSPIIPESRDNVGWWKERYTKQVETLKSQPCDVLFLGDSITDQWSTNGKNIWNKYFAKYNPCNFGISGDRTQNLIYRLENSGLPSQTDPKVCFIMIGTNNTGHSKGAEPAESTAMGILSVAQHLLVRYPNTQVIILGIFPRNTADDIRRTHNDKINTILAKCSLPRTQYVNINKHFLGKDNNLLPNISGDKLHFNEKGYEIWAKAIMPYIKKYCK